MIWGRNHLHHEVCSMNSLIRDAKWASNLSVQDKLRVSRNPSRTVEDAL
jgi:hypothetical protein